MITPDMAFRILIERGLELPTNKGYSSPRLKEIAERLAEINAERKALVNEIVGLAENESRFGLRDIPKDRSYPEDSVQCDYCGGHGCTPCGNRGWYTPKDHPAGRKCYRTSCNERLAPDWIPVYCSNECAMKDA